MDGQLLLGDRYHLLSPIRRGRTGIMWRGHDARLRRDVAIKEVQPRYRANTVDLPDARRRALREARSAGRLNHPAVVTVHDLLEEQGRLWIVMELLEGLTLKETVAHVGPLPVHWAAWIGFQLLSGLRHAHGAGVLHRDIHPGNILLTGDRVVLSDFGIAAVREDPAAAMSSTVPLRYSPAYTAPERLRGQPVSPAADLWSFGACLYFAAEGRPPSPEAEAVVTPGRTGPLPALLEGLLERDPARRITASRASGLLTETLRLEGVGVAPYRPAALRPPGG
ncbi:serine/threonine-protein kinase [Streptosporangium sp. KLBMP 9127]|nr:serine/threonine protein kinase [Streptosporangium sp. KLBMP 9127]